jgi:hypothetical protein
MSGIVATLSLIARRQNREEFSITVEIGVPYKVQDAPELWRCPVSVRPLYERITDSPGASSFQALCLATSIAQDLLADFKGQGGVLLESDGTDFLSESYSLSQKD